MGKISVISNIGYINNWLSINQETIVYYLTNIVVACIILLSGLIISRVFSYMVIKIMKMHKIDNMVVNFFVTILRYLIIIFVLTTALDHIGIQTTSIVAIIGAASLAVGLALQGLLSNFAAGLLLIIFRHFRVNDYVEIARTVGTVIVVQIFSTTLKTYDGKIVIIPNNKILSENIINFSKNQNRLISTTISMSNNANAYKIKTMIIDILLADNRIIHSMGITVRLNALNSSSIDIIIQAWVIYKEQQNTISDLLEKIKIMLDINYSNVFYKKIHVNSHEQLHKK